MDGPSAKQQKYDRQLRLWGAHGQIALEEAHVLVLGATTTGCEVVKNLVLPGTGSFTVVDDATTSASHVGTNFFLTSADVGSPLAAAACAGLQELNPDTLGHFVEAEPNAYVAEAESLPYDVVIATDVVSEATLRSLAPSHTLLVARTYGLVGLVRTSLPGESGSGSGKMHTIVESHPDHNRIDLRITNPFDGLRAHADAIDLDALDTYAYNHVPYPILLLKALDAFVALHGHPPASSADKREFRKALRALARDPEGQNNVDEASKAALRAWVKSVPSDDVAAVLAAAPAKVGPEAEPFWLAAAGLAAFVEQGVADGCLPLPGTLPDMAATTEGYIAITKVYHDQAEAEFATLRSLVDGIVADAGAPEGTVSDEYLRLVVKNAASIRSVTLSSLVDELDGSEKTTAALSAALGSGSTTATTAALYLMLRAADGFKAAHGRWPGDAPEGDPDFNWESDIPDLKTIVTSVLDSLGLADASSSGALADDLIHEFCRFANAEINPVAVVVGAVAAQEVIKLLTSQYVPMDNVFVFNGMDTTGGVLSL